MATKKRGPVPVKALRTQARTKGVGQVTSVETARILDRRYKVHKMRRDGVPIETIATTLGCAINTVRGDISEVLGQTATALYETVEEARNLEIGRYDALLRQYQPLAEAGNIAAATLVLSISDRRRKLLALDVPEAKVKEETGVRVYVGIDIDGV